MTAAQMIGYISMATDATLDLAVIKSLVVVLVSNTKDKNTAVQADSELALVSLLKLRQGQEVYQVSWGLGLGGMGVRRGLKGKGEAQPTWYIISKLYI